MDTISIRYCRVCESDMSPEEEICTKCGGVQMLRHRVPSLSLLILLVVGGFIAVVLLGIVSAISIPRLSSLRTDEHNAAALSNTIGAKKAMEGFFARSGVCPDSVEQLSFMTDEGVEINLIKTGDRMCTLVVAHVNGNKEFVACPGEDRIFCRERNVPGASFLPIR